MNLKALLEKRNDLIEKMNSVLQVAETEKRALTAEEVKSFDDMKKEIADIDKTCALSEEMRSFKPSEKENGVEESQFEKESRAFAAYIRGEKMETRSDVNFTKTDNGVIIPTTIAKKIIETVENICPIYAKASHFTIKGNLTFPKYDESTQAIKCVYADEFSAVTATAGKFSSVTLKGYLASAFTKVSRSLINNVEFDVTNYIITKVALAITRFLEHELLIGTSNKCEGVVATTQNVTAASATAITADELIDVQMLVPQIYQSGACWIMANDTFKAIRKLKDDNGEYLLNKDITNEFGYTLLGKPVYISDQMPALAAAKTPIVYGDLSGLYVKMAEESSLQVLVEKFADEHAIGVIDWIEVDSKICEVQKLAKLTMKSAS